MTTPSVGAELFCADGQIYMHDEANCRLSQLCNAPITKLLTDFLKFDLCEVV